VKADGKQTIDVSGEHITSIFEDEKEDEEDTNMKAGGWHRGDMLLLTVV
jgi:hypothetical protein